MLLKGHRIYLDALRQEDMPTMAKWMNNFELTYHLWTGAVRPQALEQEQEWFASNEKQRDKYLDFAIRTLTNEHFIGHINLRNYNNRNRTAALSILVGDTTLHGQGYGTEALQILTHYAFTEVNINRLELTVSDFNVAGIRCYEKCGFQHEGRKREAMFRDGRYHDTLLMAILREDWLAMQGQEG